MKVLVLGASPKSDRYSYKASERLMNHGHDVVPVGIRKGVIKDRDIEVIKTLPNDVDTVTLYLNPTNQIPWYNELLRIRPRRVIFNPGTENDELEELLEKEGIEVVENCTLVMLSLNHF